MKLHVDTHSGQNSITGYGPGFVMINGRRHEKSLLLTPTHLVTDWPVSCIDALNTEQMAALLQLTCDLWLLGTGQRQYFPTPSLLRPVIDARLGIEVMDTAAACRTYNVLVSEGRQVGAALVIEP